MPVPYIFLYYFSIRAFYVTVFLGQHVSVLQLCLKELLFGHNTKGFCLCFCSSEIAPIIPEVSPWFHRENELDITACFMLVGTAGNSLLSICSKYSQEHKKEVV